MNFTYRQYCKLIEMKNYKHLYYGIHSHTHHTCLVWFYGISTIVGYLMPSPVYTYLLNIYMIFKHI